MGYGIITLKFLIIVANVIFFFAGSLMFGWGVVILAAKGDDWTEVENINAFFEDNSQYRNETLNTREFKDLNRKVKIEFYALLAISMSAGVIQCIVSFLGCYGALSDKRRMLRAYAVVLSVVILLVIVATVLAFVVNNNIENLLASRGQSRRERVNDFLDALDIYGPFLAVIMGIELIMVVFACFLATIIKRDQFIWSNFKWVI